MSEEYLDDYLALQEIVQRNAHTDKDFQASTFFEIFSETAAEAGDAPDLDSLEILFDGTKSSYQIDGFCFDQKTRELVLAIVDYDNTPEVRRMHTPASENFFERCLNFFKSALKPDFIEELEESSDAFFLADLINSKRKFIQRVRVVLFTNAVSVRQKAIEAENWEQFQFTKNLFDLKRYIKIISSQTGSEPVEIDLDEFGHGPISCLKTVTGTNEYDSYLCVMPGPLLAEIYAVYGPKLLEQNVRVFLQARTKVNKGIIETITSKPAMFFAYNNGLTITASSIETKVNPSGQLVISKLTDFQIVNGGQTTASILYARDISKVDISAVSVQMKLSVIPAEKLAKEVPTISRHSNMQNKISEADLSSSHPFHTLIERTAQRMLTPVQGGTSTGSKWFYERARGQYRNRQTYMSKTNKNRFLAEFPKNQVLVKTDIAKYELSVEQKPYLVSLGAQKCFMAFSTAVSKKWETRENEFNDLYFQKAVSHAILFRTLDGHIASSQWYKEDRGFKAQIVTYTIAYFSYWLQNNRSSIDTDKIWKTQTVDEETLALLDYISQKISHFVKTPPPSYTNPSEYCKRTICWDDLKKLDMEITANPQSIGVSNEEVKENKKQAVQDRRVDKELEFEVKLMELAPKADAIRFDAARLKLLTPVSDKGLLKIKRGALNITFLEKKALAELLEQLADLDKAF